MTHTRGGESRARRGERGCPLAQGGKVIYHMVQFVIGTAIREERIKRKRRKII